jgi:hypothetical protein
MTSHLSGRTAALATLALALSACSTNYQLAKPDPQTGYLPTDVSVESEHLKTFHTSARVHDVRFIYVRTATAAPDFMRFLDQELAQLGFPPVMHRDDLTKIVVKSDLIDSVGNVTDPVALAKLSKAIGPFFVLDVAVAYGGYGHTHAYARLIDPESADVLLEVDRPRTAWTSMDREVNYPLLNVLERWWRESKALPKESRAAAAPTT